MPNTNESSASSVIPPHGEVHGGRRTLPGRVRVRRRAGISGLYDVSPVTVKDVKDRIKKRHRRRHRKRRHKCGETFGPLKRKVGEYSDPPQGQSKSRFRVISDPRSSGVLGVVKLIDVHGGEIIRDTIPFLSYPKIKKCWDEVHPWIQTFDLYSQGEGVPTARCNRLRYRDGGPFALYSCEIPVFETQGLGSYHGRDFREYGGYLAEYDGGFVPANWDHGFTAEEFLQAGTDGATLGLDYMSPAAYGPEAWNKFKPRTQAFDAMQFLFDDVKDLPQQLATTAELMRNSYTGFLSRSASRSERRAARNLVLMPGSLANQYLNYEFGWAPFIGDLQKLHRAYSEMNKRMAQLRRDNNRWIHRGGSVLDIRERSPVTTVSDFAGVVYPPLTSDYYSPGPGGAYVTSHLYTETEKSVWFSGNFKYHVPGFTSPKTHADAYETMGELVHYYGLGISPQVIWELTPWTWLVDWFSNVGENVSNLSSMLTDQLVSREAYVMCHSKVRVVNDSTIYLNGGPVKCFWYQNVETKKRTQASPFGFGLTGDDLSARQLAILASLFGVRSRPAPGLTGGPR